MGPDLIHTGRTTGIPVVADTLSPEISTVSRLPGVRSSLPKVP